MLVTAKGQVTIPKHIRDAAGVSAGSEVTFSLEGSRIIITPVGTGVRDDRLLARAHHRKHFPDQELMLGGLFSFPSQEGWTVQTWLKQWQAHGGSFRFEALNQPKQVESSANDEGRLS